MLRRSGQRFAYVLIAALLLAQLGLALHGLSHGVDALKLAKSQSDPRGLPADRHCDLCLTYAQVAAGAPPAPLVVVAPVLDAAQSARPAGAAGTAVARAYDSRAPPRAA